MAVKFNWPNFDDQCLIGEVQTTHTRTPDFDAIGLPATKTPFIHLCWLLHNQCNHRCSYCAEINWGGSFKDLNLQHAKRFVEKTIEHYQNRRLMISFTGGEPTLWPEFGEFVDWLKTKNTVIAMTTNGARPKSFFELHSKRFSWISFSYHPEFTRPERFLENVIEASRWCLVTIRIMFPPTKAEFEKSEKFLELVKEYQRLGKFPNFVRCESVPVATGFGSEFTAPAKYTVQQEQVFKSPIFTINENIAIKDDAPINDLRAFKLDSPQVEHSFDAHEHVSSGKANFENWSCDIGLEQLFIDHRGQVVRAGCRVGGTVGWLKHGVFDFPSKPVLCPKNYCHCITDVLTSKRSPAWQREQSKEAHSLLAGAWFEFIKTRFRFLNWMTQTQARLEMAESELQPPKADVFAFRVYQPLRFVYRFVFRAANFLFVRVFWSRPVRKPYYFLRFQFRKRILGKTNI